MGQDLYKRDKMSPFSIYYFPGRQDTRGQIYKGVRGRVGYIYIKALLNSISFEDLLRGAGVGGVLIREVDLNSNQNEDTYKRNEMDLLMF